MFSAGLTSKTRIVASSSVCQEFRNQLFGNGSTSYVQIRTATKRGAGSSKNGRDSAGKRLGIKVVTGEYVIPGNVLVRQRGQKFHPGQAVSMGRDHTLMANEPGYVYYYEHHIPFPHQQTSKLQPPESSYISKPGSIDNGLRAVRQSMKEKDFAPVKFPRGLKRYVGIVRHKDEILPRDQRDQGRERRFWKLSEPEVFKPF